MSQQSPTDLLVFSHLRWNFVFQRPQHLMSRFAKHRRVFFVEEPVFDAMSSPQMKIKRSEEGVYVVTPHLPQATATKNHQFILAALVDDLIIDENISNYSIWYYTPMSLPFSRHLSPDAIIFDVMDELSLFKNAPPILAELENELFKKADVVFTGGQALFEAKKHRHHNIHAFPSSIDKEHFHQARQNMLEPEDQITIPNPRIGFFGVIDERTNLNLLKEMAQMRPDYHFVMIGPVVKIDPATLPQASNIHYLGQKNYRELPSYIAGWDCAMMPFALNDATKYISPTKTLEYLAAGKPVVSTSIKDVVRPYGENGLVHIADQAADFIAAIAKSIPQRRSQPWLTQVDQFLNHVSWDQTWQNMAALELDLLNEKTFAEVSNKEKTTVASFNAMEIGGA